MLKMRAYVKCVVLSLLACTYAATITDAPTPTPTATESDTEYDGVWTTIIDDPWNCITENATQYFDFPEPTGDVLTALLSYGDVIRPTSCGSIICFPEPTAWCGFEKAAPSSVLPAYSSFGSAVASWYDQHSSGIEAMPTDCPQTWNQAKYQKLFGELALNNTIAWAECFEKEHPERRDMPELAATALL